MVSGMHLSEWLEVNEHRIKRWRAIGVRVVTVLAIALVLHLVYTLLDPISALRQESLLEREQGVKLVQVSSARLKRFSRLSELDGVVKRPCAEVMRISDGKTSKSSPQQPHYAITNLIALNRQLILKEGIAFAAPKLLVDVGDGTAPDACLLSIVLSGGVYEGSNETTSSNDAVRIIDMVNPQELELRAHERQQYSTLSESVELRDLLIKSNDIYTIESLPFIRINYRTIENTVQVLTLHNNDAHLMRVALRLLNHGEPVSAWGTTTATEEEELPLALPSKPTTLRISDEL